MVTNSKNPLRRVPSAKNHDVSGPAAPSTSWAPLIEPLPKSWMKYIGRSATMPTPLVDRTATETPADPGADDCGSALPIPAGSVSEYTWTVRLALGGTVRGLVTGDVWPSML